MDADLHSTWLAAFLTCTVAMPATLALGIAANAFLCSSSECGCGEHGRSPTLFDENLLWVAWPAAAALLILAGLIPRIT